MKRFISCAILFILLFSVVYSSFVYVYNRNTKDVLRIPEDRHILFLGNSHIETSINDSIITGAYNFAHSSEDIIFAYAKLVMMKKYNPQIDTVVFGFDDILSSNSRNADYFLDAFSPRYFQQLSIKDVYELSRKYNSSYIYDNAIHLMDIIKLRRNQKAIGMGGYLWLERDKLQGERRVLPARCKSSLKRHSAKELASLPYTYMDKIVNFCRNNNIKLIFIWAPQSPYSPLKQNQIEELSQILYPEVTFYNFVNMELPESCYGDLDHLNYRGAKVFSEYIEKSGILK